MPLSTCRIIGQYSQPSSWHHPSELLPSLSQPYEDPSSWTPNDSTPTSSPTYKTTQFPPNTSIPSQTEHGPEPQTGYFSMQDAYMSLTWATFDYVFSSTRTIIPLQAIMARRRHCTQSEDSITGPDSQPSSKNIARHAPLAHVPSLCATDLTDFSVEVTGAPVGLCADLAWGRCRQRTQHNLFAPVGHRSDRADRRAPAGARAAAAT